MFGLLGATTPLSQTAWNAMGKIGSRLLFLKAGTPQHTQERLRRAKEILTSNVPFRTKVKLARKAVNRYMEVFLAHYRPSSYTVPEEAPENLRSEQALMEHCGYLPRSVGWDRTRDQEEALEDIARLAEFLTRCRQDICIWQEETEDGRKQTNPTGATEEGVDRTVANLYNLARCHALTMGRSFVNLDDIPLLTAVTFSSLPDDRRTAMQLLVEPWRRQKDSPEGEFTVTELAKAMGCADKTDKRIMGKLQLTGIGTVIPGSGSCPARFRLHREYGWLTEAPFRGLYCSWHSVEGSDLM